MKIQTEDVSGILKTKTEIAEIKAKQTDAMKAYDRHASHVQKAVNVNLDQALQKLQKTANIFNKKLSFSVHQSSKRVVVRVIDAETNQVIRQIPAPEILTLIEEIQKMIGVFIDNRM